MALFALFLYKWRCHPTGNLDPGSVVLFISGAVAFITSVAWMNIQANEVVAVLQTFGIIFDVSIGKFVIISVLVSSADVHLGVSHDAAVLGVTVLAIGNSVGDWVADTTVARQGKPAMGVSSCFGSPLLNDVLGLGISLTVRNHSTLHMTHAGMLSWRQSDSEITHLCCVVGHAMSVLLLYTEPILFEQ